MGDNCHSGTARCQNRLPAPPKTPIFRSRARLAPAEDESHLSIFGLLAALQPLPDRGACASYFLAQPTTRLDRAHRRTIHQQTHALHLTPLPANGLANLQDRGRIQEPGTSNETILRWPQRYFPAILLIRPREQTCRTESRLKNPPSSTPRRFARRLNRASLREPR